MSKVVSTAKLVLFAAIFGAMIFVGGGCNNSSSDDDNPPVENPDDTNKPDDSNNPGGGAPRCARCPRPSPGGSCFVPVRQHAPQFLVAVVDSARGQKGC